MSEIKIKQESGYWKCRCGIIAMPLRDDTECNCKDIYEQEWTFVKVEPAAEPAKDEPCRLAKNKSTQRGKEFWDHVEAIAVQVRNEPATQQAPAVPPTGGVRVSDAQWMILASAQIAQLNAQIAALTEKLEQIEQRYAELKDGYRLRVEDIDDLQEKLEQAGARLAILDAQEVVLGDWPDSAALKAEAERWWNSIKDHEGGSVGAKSWYRCALSRESQLLDAQRVIRAANGVIEAARRIRHWHDAMKDNLGMVKLWEAIAAYDALAGQR